MRTINLGGLWWSERPWVGHPLRACCLLLLSRINRRCAPLSPTLSQMSTRWKEWRKSSTSAEKRRERTARKARCVVFLLSSLFFILSLVEYLMAACKNTVSLFGVSRDANFGITQKEALERRAASICMLMRNYCNPIMQEDRGASIYTWHWLYKSDTFG